MARNKNTTNSETQSQGTCRNVFRAFRRRVSPARPLATQSPISTNRAGVKPSTAVTPASNKVLVEYNHSNNNAKRPEPMKPGGPVNTHQNQPAPKGVKFQEYGYSGVASDEKFAGFIKKVRSNIKANSSFVADENGPRAAGTKRATTRRDSFNDKVSHFINRAKLHMRTNTIVAASDHADGKLQPYTPR